VTLLTSIALLSVAAVVSIFMCFKKFKTAHINEIDDDFMYDIVQLTFLLIDLADKADYNYILYIV
jgi:hypothetical protein